MKALDRRLQGHYNYYVPARQIRENPDARIMVWAHNAYVSLAYSRFVGGIRLQGEIIHEQMGDQVYTIGIYSGTGRAYAWFMNEDYTLEEPAEDSLEGRLLALEGDVVFADLADERARGNEWVSQPIVSFCTTACWSFVKSLR